jgi:hypothetical protein
MFLSRTGAEKRRILNFVTSNAVWHNDALTVSYRQPFDLLADAGRKDRALIAAGASQDDRMTGWWAL